MTGPTGTGGYADAVRIQGEDFTQGSTSPVVIFNPPDNSTIMKVQVQVTTAASASGASVTVGNASDNDRFMEASDIDLETAGIYEKGCIDNLGVSPEAIQLFITPGGQIFSGEVTIWYADIG